MRLIGVTVVRDEADIFEAFARSNLHFLDALYVVLHRSRDGTREIAAALRRRGRSCASSRTSAKASCRRPS